MVQAQRSADRDGWTPGRLRTRGAQTVVRARGRLRVAETAGRAPAPAGRGRRTVQRILPVEGHRRVYRYQVLLPAVRDAARRRWRAGQTLPERQRLVARPGRVQQRDAVAEVHRVVRRRFRRRCRTGRPRSRQNPRRQITFTARGGRRVPHDHRQPSSTSPYHRPGYRRLLADHQAATECRPTTTAAAAATAAHTHVQRRAQTSQRPAEELA